MKTIKQYEKNDNDSAVCSSCGEFQVRPESIWFDESGYGYSTKLTRCPYCGKIIIVKYIEDYGMDVNMDWRFYHYE